MLIDIYTCLMDDTENPLASLDLFRLTDLGYYSTFVLDGLCVMRVGLLYQLQLGCVYFTWTVSDHVRA